MSHLTIFGYAGTELILPGYLTSYLLIKNRLVQVQNKFILQHYVSTPFFWLHGLPLYDYAPYTRVVTMFYLCRVF